MEAIQNSVNDAERAREVIAQPLASPEQTGPASIVVDASNALLSAVNTLNELAGKQTQNEVKLTVDENNSEFSVNLMLDDNTVIQKFAAALTVNNNGAIQFVTKEI